MYNENEELIVPLELENGEKIDCVVISVFEADGSNYIALLPKEDDEILMYRYIESANDEIVLENIDSDFEFNRVLEVFDGLMEDIE